jgi:chromosome segregation protein
VSRHGVRFYAADDRKAGLLARRQEIENIERELRAQKLLVEQAGAALVRAESALRLAQESQHKERQAVELARNQLHGVQLDAVRLGELIEVWRDHVFVAMTADSASRLVVGEQEHDVWRHRRVRRARDQTAK